MSIDLSGKKIVMIHGLASKPPREDVHSLWTKCLIENVRVDDSALAGEMEKQKDIFHSAYWADFTSQSHS
ncbi:MAG: hypothetical protein JXB45_03325 [Candidatus Krumholzibacteriota bacterium]|nr:hypothetical protein [Candidatus Krumholzibacteriota bacterium]